MADRDYYCKSIDAPFRTGADCITEGHDNVAAESLTYVVTQLVRAAAVDGQCPLEDYAQALSRLLETPPELRSDFLFDPLPTAPGKVAELARRAMLDIATDIEFGGLIPDHLPSTLLARTCQEVQEWALLTRFEVNARLGVNGESPRVRQSIAKVREQTRASYADLAAKCEGNPRSENFKTAKVSKPKPDKNGPLATWLGPKE